MEAEPFPEEVCLITEILFHMEEPGEDLEEVLVAEVLEGALEVLEVEALVAVVLVAPGD